MVAIQFIKVCNVKYPWLSLRFRSVLSTRCSQQIHLLFQVLVQQGQRFLQKETKNMLLRPILHRIVLKRSNCVTSDCYRPETKFAKVMLSQVSVCPQGGLPLVPWGCLPPPPGRHPSPWADTPWKDTPLGRQPQGRHPPAQCMLEYTPPPPPSACWDTVNKWAVRIPLECILVLFFFLILYSVAFKARLHLASMIDLARQHQRLYHI